MRNSFTVENTGERLDVFLTGQMPEFSRSHIQKLIASGQAWVNGVNRKGNFKLKPHDVVELEVPEPEQVAILPEDIPLDILYEDKDIIVINKARGMVVHPAPGHYTGTLVNALMYRIKDLSSINGVARPGILHRIDKNTSGLLIVAKNDFAHISLSEQIKAHTFTREYQTVVYGHFKTESGTVEAPIGRHPVDRKKMAVTPKNSKHAVTHYFVEESYRDFTHLKVRLETGRTHQIRVHMSYIGHPVAGDSVYGPKKVITSLNGQCLHAGLIGFKHPRTSKYIEIESELPEYFTSFLRSLK